MFRASPVSRFLGNLLLLAGLFSAVSVVIAQQGQPRIIGGHEAEPGEWPWQVGLISKDLSLEIGPFCSGTLIDPYWVLTAAHCVDYIEPENIEVLAGIHNLLAPDPNFVREGVSYVFIYPDWLGDVFGDVALIRLQNPIETREGAVDGTLPIAPVPLVAADVGQLEGVDSVVTGWGSIDEVEWLFPGVLYEVGIPITTDAECRRVFGTVTDASLCAGVPEGGKDSCNGDNGGPLVVYNDTKEQWEQAGIVVGGYGCAQPELPGIYTRVSYFTDWIAQTMEYVPTYSSISLPLVIKTAYPPVSLIPNGDFESGSEGWTETSDAQLVLINNQKDLPALRPPHSGEWAAWLGGAVSDDATLSRDVDVPQEETFLTFVYWLDSVDGCGYDSARVEIDGITVDSFAPCYGNNTGGWVRRFVDLSEYAGKTVNLRFSLYNDYVGVSNWFLDDIGFSTGYNYPGAP